MARHGKFWEMAAHSGSALSAILEERARKYGLAVRSWNLGLRWIELYEDTRQKFKNAYDRLGKLAMELEELRMRGEKPGQGERYSGEFKGIYLYIANAEGSYFDPFCKRIQPAEFQNLSKVPDMAADRDWERIERTAKIAQAKIEVFVKGEMPTRTEIREGNKMFSVRE